MSELMIEHILQDVRTEVKAMHKQLDSMNDDIQKIKRQLAENTAKKSPCDKNGCTAEARIACTGCPEFYEWKEKSGNDA